MRRTIRRSGACRRSNVIDRDAVDDAVRNLEPDCIVHLAGIAAPAMASADPQLAWRVHVDGTLNIAHSILDMNPRCTLLSIGSGMVYGASANLKAQLDEDTILAPMDEYAVTKAAADLALGALAHKGLRCVRFRPFNHTGPGQDEAFVVPSFAMQIARIEAGLQSPVIRVGNLDAVRDLLDVRDVTDAYALAVKNAALIRPGTILNVGSGTGHRIGDILARLLALAREKIEVQQDPARMRPADVPRIVGDASRARMMLHWEPKYSFDNLLRDVLEDCRKRVATSSAGA